MTKLFIQLFLLFFALGMKYFHRSISLSLFCFYQVLSSFNNITEVMFACINILVFFIYFISKWTMVELFSSTFLFLVT